MSRPKLFRLHLQQFDEKRVVPALNALRAAKPSLVFLTAVNFTNGSQLAKFAASLTTANRLSGLQTVFRTYDT